LDVKREDEIGYKKSGSYGMVVMKNNVTYALTTAEIWYQMLQEGETFSKKFSTAPH
jgi:hypothetical protein